MGDLQTVMEYKFIYLDKTHSVKISSIDKGYQVIVDGKAYDILEPWSRDNIITFRIEDRLCRVCFAEDKGMIYLSINGDFYSFSLDRSRSGKGRRPHDQPGDSVSSPMPGLLVKLMVKVGDEVEQDTTLAVVEAMKMQNELRAPRCGTIKKINNREGDQVEALKPIVELDEQ
jgi:acetyl/propionyl-CoA carboxylase alpha subunit